MPGSSAKGSQGLRYVVCDKRTKGLVACLVGIGEVHILPVGMIFRDIEDERSSGVMPLTGIEMNAEENLGVMLGRESRPLHRADMDVVIAGQKCFYVQPDSTRRDREGGLDFLRIFKSQIFLEDSFRGRGGIVIGRAATSLARVGFTGHITAAMPRINDHNVCSPVQAPG